MFKFIYSNQKLSIPYHLALLHDESAADVHDDKLMREFRSLLIVDNNSHRIDETIDLTNQLLQLIGAMKTISSKRQCIELLLSCESITVSSLAAIIDSCQQSIVKANVVCICINYFRSHL